MAGKKQKNNNNNNSSKGKKSGPKPQPRRGRASRRALTAVEKMIADPCHGPIEPVYTAEFGGGTVLKVRQRIPIHDLSTSRNGFLIWYPDYVNGGQDGSTTTSVKTAPIRPGGANLFLYETADPSLSPINSSVAGGFFGTGLTATAPEGVSLPDPGHTIANTPNISGVRTLGACMRVVYTGRADLRQGEMVAIHHLPSSGLLDPKGDITSPGDLLTYGYDTFRVQDKELIWRPGNNSQHARKPGTLAFGATDQLGVEDSYSDSAFRLGFGTTRTRTSNDSQPGESSGFGFAWVNLPSNGENDVYIEITKVIQFQFAPLNRSVESVPYHIKSREPQTPEEAVAGVDQKLGPGWSFRNAGTYAQQASDIIQDVALGGLKLANTYHAVRGARGRNPEYELL